MTCKKMIFSYSDSIISPPFVKEDEQDEHFNFDTFKANFQVICNYIFSCKASIRVPRRIKWGEQSAVGKA